MSFLTDKQTLDDLGLLGKFKPGSIFALFNKVVTAGGESLLEEMFRNPMTNPEAINQRSALFRYFQEKDLRFPFERASFQVVENYLRGSAPGNAPGALVEMVRKKIMQRLLHSEQYADLQEGLMATIRALLLLKDLVATLDIPMLVPVRGIFSSRSLEWLTPAAGANKPTVLETARLNRLLRTTMKKEMETLLHTIYSLDVYLAVSGVARTRGFSYAEMLPASQNCFSTTALRHPGLDQAVANPLHLHRDGNVLFLTGANMAGKSTFMKSFGIAVYLAHMGFPVAARDMQIAVRDGLYSSINVPDNLNKGYSHFYAEVLRVKRVAEEVSSGKKLVVLFDELFKGTNVKDAYDATLSVTAAFSRYRDCFFIISTHIIEVGEALKKQQGGILFAYFPTVMEGAVPSYSYTITEGITSDRQGMIIIEKEGILELL
jgi:DNA mismatch repair ATPase MutS